MAAPPDAGEPAVDLLDLPNFVTRFSAAAPQNPCVRKLQALLSRLRPDAGLPELTSWLEDLAGWIHERGAVPGRAAFQTTADARLQLLLAAVAELPRVRGMLAEVVRRVLADGQGERLFTDTGLPARSAFFGEMAERVARRLLPEPPADNDLARLLFRLFPHEKVVAWFEGLAPERRALLLDALGISPARLVELLRPAMVEACRVLSIRISALGSADDVRERARLPTVADSPFVRLPRAVEACFAEGPGGGNGDGAAQASFVLREAIAACRHETHRVHATVERTGVSVDLVYRLDLINRYLDRLYLLKALVVPAEGAAAPGVGERLASALIRGGVRDRSLTELFRSGSRLLARRVIERAGQGGEHYITRTRAEQHRMLSSAAGGGAITALMIILKFLISWGQLPLLNETLLVGLNYGLGFVAMQLLHFTLATKQPAMTAAALAGAIQDAEQSERPDLEPLVEQVVRTFRSQLAALVGNLGMVLPMCLLLDLGSLAVFGEHILDQKYAEKVIAAHHPLFSGTVLYACITGGCLWASSIIAGMVENWFVLRRLQDAIATHRRLRWLVGPERAKKVADFFHANISGLGGNMGFGMLLGFVPFVGLLVGLPLEVRHVTFVTGSLAFAGAQRGAEGVLSADFLSAVGAIGLVGMLNFGVSFSLALIVAFRARGLGLRGQVALGRAVLARARRTPLDFIRAPLEAAPQPSAPPAL